MRHRAVATWLLMATLVLVGCSEDTEREARETATSLREEAEEATRDVREAAQDAWASLRTDGERLVDEVRTRDDPAAQQRLLEECRDTLERLRRAESPGAGRVDELCNRIRNTDVHDDSAWDDIKRELQRLNPLD